MIVRKEEGMKKKRICDLKSQDLSDFKSLGLAEKLKTMKRGIYGIRVKLQERVENR